jgi:hypothetical protein
MLRPISLGVAFRLPFTEQTRMDIWRTGADDFADAGSQRVLLAFTYSLSAQSHCAAAKLRTKG